MRLSKTNSVLIITCIICLESLLVSCYSYTEDKRVRRNHRQMTDAGYGSRIGAASKIASALVAQRQLYGAYGPGRRKRPSNPVSNDQGDRQD